MMSNTSCLSAEWPNQPVCFLPYIYLAVMGIYMVILIILLISIRHRLENKLTREQKKPSKDYENMYAAVLQKSQPKLARIGILCGKIVYAQLKHHSDPAWDSDEAQAPEVEMYSIYQAIYIAIHPKTSQEKKLFFYALRFVLKSSLIVCPYDIRGSRRCKTAERVLNSLQTGQNIPQYTTSSKFDFHKHPVFKHGVVYLFLIIFILGLWLYDLYTDMSVVALYVNLTCQLDTKNQFCPTALYNWITTNGTKVIMFKCVEVTNHTVSCMNTDYIVIMLGLHNINHISFICISLTVFLFSKPIKKWGTLVYVKLRMSLPIHERNETHMKTKFVQDRYKLGIHEAGSESFLSMGVSTGNYLNIMYMLNQLTKNNTELSNEIDALINEETIVKSICVSILSLILAQLKAYNTQHEYTTCTKHKLLLTAAVTINTVSYAVLFAACKATCMFWCCNTFFFKQEIGTTLHNIGYFVVGIVCIWLTFLVKRLAVFLTDIFFKKYVKIERDILPRSSRLSEFFNPASIYQLPDSNTHVQSYNSLQSSESLIRQGRQFIGTILLLVWLIVLSIDNFTTHRFDIDKSVEWQIFYCTGILVVPLGHLLQYVVLGFSYRFDEGFFTQSTTYFEYSSIQGHDVQALKNMAMAETYEYAGNKDINVDMEHEENIENIALAIGKYVDAPEDPGECIESCPGWMERASLKSGKTYITGTWHNIPPPTVTAEDIHCTCRVDNALINAISEPLGTKRKTNCPHNANISEGL